MRDSNRPRPRAIARWLLPGLLLSALSAPHAWAVDLPPLYHITITPEFNQGVLVAPQAISGTTYTVTILNDDDVPMTNVTVQFVFLPSIRICADAVHYAVTDQTGTCQVQLRAGGCINTPTLGACVVVANGIEIRNYSRVKSPDNASHTGSQPSGSVTVADLIFFAQEFKGETAAACHDYNNDGTVNTGDLPTFGDAFRMGLACTLAP